MTAGDQGHPGGERPQVLEYLGLDVEEARHRAADRGLRVRVIEPGTAITADRRTQRLNLWSDEGRVVRAEMF